MPLLRSFADRYDFAVGPRRHQLTFCSVDFTSEANLGVDLSGDTALGALGLDPTKAYYVYDFWNDRSVGKLKVDARLEQALRARILIPAIARPWFPLPFAYRVSPGASQRAQRCHP